MKDFYGEKFGKFKKKKIFLTMFFSKFFQKIFFWWFFFQNFFNFFSKIFFRLTIFATANSFNNNDFWAWCAKNCERSELSAASLAPAAEGCDSGSSHLKLSWTHSTFIKRNWVKMILYFQRMDCMWSHMGESLLETNHCQYGHSWPLSSSNYSDVYWAYAHLQVC